MVGGHQCFFGFDFGNDGPDIPDFPCCPVRFVNLDSLAEYICRLKSGIRQYRRLGQIQSHFFRVGHLADENIAGGVNSTKQYLPGTNQYIAA